MLDGMHRAVAEGIDVQIGIHGSMSAVTGEGYIDDLKASIAALGDRAVFHGPYQQAQVQSLMAGYHWVAMGSRWYENSPVVIQESIAAGRPLMVPAHGGMVEKTEGISISFVPGSAADFARALATLDRKRYGQLQSAVKERRARIPVDKQHNFERTAATYQAGTQQG